MTDYGSSRQLTNARRRLSGAEHFREHRDLAVGERHQAQ
jgi:hypothetical protein